LGCGRSPFDPYMAAVASRNMPLYRYKSFLFIKLQIYARVSAGRYCGDRRALPMRSCYKFQRIPNETAILSSSSGGNGFGHGARGPITQAHTRHRPELPAPSPYGRRVGRSPNYGRGCAGCHAPHSGAWGEGGNALTGTSPMPTRRQCPVCQDMGPLWARRLISGRFQHRSANRYLLATAANSNPTK